MPKIFLTRPLPAPAGSCLAAQEVRIHPGPYPIPRDELLRGAAWADALVCQLTDAIDEAVLAAGGRPLRAVANYAVGVDNIDLAAAARLGVPVVNTPDVLTEATAELAWALILGVARRVGEGDRLTRSGGFPGWAPEFLLGTGLTGRSLGIVGLGRIGRATARRAPAFGMEVVYHSRSRKTEAVEAASGGARYLADLDELLATSDVVSLHCPLSESTRHLLDEARLRTMKPGAFLINTGRGPLVDEAALVRVLADGHLGGAGLDVYEDEPALAPGLGELPNTLLLPHVGSATHRVRGEMARLACEGVRALLAGEKPANLVHPPMLD